MTVQQALIEYPYITSRVQALNREINEMLSIKHDTSITARLTGMPPSGQISNPTLQAVEQIVDRLDVHIDRIKDRINRLLDAKELVDSRLDRLDIQERRVIEHRYFSGRNWPEIQESMRYSRTTVFRIHGSALDKMADNGTKWDYVGLQTHLTV